MEVMVNFTYRPLYPQGNSPWYPLDRRLRGSQSRSGRNGEEKNSQPRRKRTLESRAGISSYYSASKLVNTDRVGLSGNASDLLEKSPVPILARALTNLTDVSS